MRIVKIEDRATLRLLNYSLRHSIWTFDIVHCITLNLVETTKEKPDVAVLSHSLLKGKGLKVLTKFFHFTYSFNILQCAYLVWWVQMGASICI